MKKINVKIEAIELENIRDNIESFEKILELCANQDGYRNELKREVDYIKLVKKQHINNKQSDNLLYYVELKKLIYNISMFAISTNRMLKEQENISPYLYEQVYIKAIFNKTLLEEIIAEIKIQVDDPDLIEEINKAEEYINSIALPNELYANENLKR